MELPPAGNGMLRDWPLGAVGGALEGERGTVSVVITFFAELSSRDGSC